MANTLYTASGTPGTGSSVLSQPERTEFADIAAGFSLLPDFTSAPAGAMVRVNASNSGFDTTNALSIAGTFTTAGAYNLTFTLGATVNLTLPTANATLIGRITTDTLTNKTFDTANNTFKVNGGTGVTGTGSFVLATGPTIANAAFVTPILGAATATSINGLGITGTGGKTFTLSNSAIIQSSVGDGKTLEVGGGAQFSQEDGTVQLVNGAPFVVLTLTTGFYIVVADGVADAFHAASGACMAVGVSSSAAVLVASGGHNATFGTSGASITVTNSSGVLINAHVLHTRLNY